MTDSITKPIWKSVIRAVEADPREVTSITGISGVVHPILGLGVDEKRSRVIIVSGDADARAAAMMQSDVQQTFPDVRVVVARPVAVNFAGIATKIVRQIGSPSVFISRLAELMKVGPDSPELATFIEPYLEPIRSVLASSAIDGLAFFIEATRQLSLVDYRKLDSGVDSSGKPIEDLELTFSRLTGNDPTSRDRELGVCPIPLYAFGEDDLDTLTIGRSVEAAVEILRRHEIHQYFFPAPDVTALSLIDRGMVGRNEVVKAVEVAPQLGHPLGDPELVDMRHTVLEMVEALEHDGRYVEGEIDMTLTESGREARATLKFKPRESAVSKLINRANFNFDLHKLFRGGE
jgi:hypothetical protein